MGYEVHITRKEHWSGEEDRSGISLDEWLSYVRSDPEMRLDGFVEAEVDGSILRIEGDGIAVWMPGLGNGKADNPAWLYFSEDTIDVPHPDIELRKKIWKIAQQF